MVIIHKVPRSLVANIMDLGVWADFQTAVEHKHFVKRCNTEAYARSVYDIWNTSKLKIFISTVFKELERVVCMINEGR